MNFKDVDYTKDKDNVTKIKQINAYNKPNLENKPNFQNEKIVNTAIFHESFGLKDAQIRPQTQF